MLTITQISLNGYFFEKYPTALRAYKFQTLPYIDIFHNPIYRKLLL